MEERQDLLPRPRNELRRSVKVPFPGGIRARGRIRRQRMEGRTSPLMRMMGWILTATDHHHPARKESRPRRPRRHRHDDRPFLDPLDSPHPSPNQLSHQHRAHLPGRHPVAQSLKSNFRHYPPNESRSRITFHRCKHLATLSNPVTALVRR
jgi:hypothetical protein